MGRGPIVVDHLDDVHASDYAESVLFPVLALATWHPDHLQDRRVRLLHDVSRASPASRRPRDALRFHARSRTHRSTSFTPRVSGALSLEGEPGIADYGPGHTPAYLRTRM